MTLRLLTGEEEVHEVVVGEVEQQGKTMVICRVEALGPPAKEAIDDDVIFEQPASGPPAQPADLIRRRKHIAVRLAKGVCLHETF